MNCAVKPIHNSSFIIHHFVEVSGFEPLTPAMSRRYSNQLSYTSIVLFLKSDAKIQAVFVFQSPHPSFFIFWKYE